MDRTIAERIAEHLDRDSAAITYSYVAFDLGDRYYPRVMSHLRQCFCGFSEPIYFMTLAAAISNAQRFPFMSHQKVAHITQCRGPSKPHSHYHERFLRARGHWREPLTGSRICY
jgi:hypothetical protein